MKMILKYAMLVSALYCGTSAMASTAVLIEAEGFTKRGGWVVDQQFMDQMGSPFLLAHGMGKPVADAVTEVAFPSSGSYHVWVRTRDWVGQWKGAGTQKDMKASGYPGRFQILVDGKTLNREFGKESADWKWEDGGTVSINNKSAKVALHDLVGFDGRCDAILFTQESHPHIPNKDPEMANFRRKLLGYPEKAQDAGQYDLVVVGGGIAGICAAINGARSGCKVALIQDRPVLGGNNSSEIRVHLGGRTMLPPYPRLGEVVQEIDPLQHGNAEPGDVYRDDKKLAVVMAEKNIALFLNMHMNAVEMDGSRIKAVIAQNIESGKRLRFPSQMFADCTGDGTVGYRAGADFRHGREAKSETGENRAIDIADTMTMGTSIMWYAVDGKEDFPATPWALQFNSQTVQKLKKGNWNWETGMRHHQVDNFEYIRDYGMRAVFGNWSSLKNNPETKEAYADNKLGWVAYMGGKRESRRLMGDVILKQQDIETGKKFPDGCVVTTWTIDLHYPVPTKGLEAEPFRSTAKHTRIKPYPVPYRSLYSRNVDNLFMAGRNISVTHVALGTVRVMRTTGLMGEVVGLAAGLCKKHSTTPRGVYKSHLAEFINIMGQPSTRAITAEMFYTTKVDEKLLRTTRNYKVIDIPEKLHEAQCVTVERGDMGLAGAEFKFVVDRPVTVYLAVHNRGGYKPAQPWKPTGLKIKWDKGTDMVYSAKFPAGKIKIPSHTGKEGANYGVPNMAIILPENGNPDDLKITPEKQH